MKYIIGLLCFTFGLLLQQNSAYAYPDTQSSYATQQQTSSNYSGNCDCPYDRDAKGNRCGDRSAWSRSGGRSPACYKNTAHQITTDQIAIRMIQDSINSYPGSCACPYQKINGTLCGGRSAWSTPGGYQPLCYPSDITNDQLKNNRANVQNEIIKDPCTQISNYSSQPAASNSDVYVKGYYRDNGTYVKPYCRSAPNGTVNDNFSTKGNINPYTGDKGYKKPDSNN